MNLEDLAVKLYNLGMVKIGDFILSSGIRSPFYIDLRELIGYPKILKDIAGLILTEAKKRTVFEVVVGIATGGIPLASYISCIANIPMAYVRKEEKKHGTGKLLEGFVVDRKVLLVDDVATTGQSLERAVNVVRDNGGTIENAIVVIDREQGAKERLRRIGVNLFSLLTAKELFEILMQKGIISRNKYEEIIEYINKTKST
ncbi:MAG: orotate phosphoribosyltransferase [Candidatus Njordarchaeales archaeon]